MSWTALLALVAGLPLLLLGAEALVEGAARLARRFGVSSLVIGLTVVAFGTSAPELAVSLMAALGGQADLALGNVLGSNVFNGLVILGLAALAAPLAVSARLVRLDLPLLLAASLGTWALAADGDLSRGDGLLLLAGFAAWNGWTFRLAMRDRAAEGSRAEDDAAEPPGDEPPRPGALGIALDLGRVAVGLALLVFGSRLLVSGASALALALGVDERVVGLTVVAAGTSLPELATSVLASRKGERDIAVGNVVGSNLFNLLLILGATATLAPRGVAVSAASLGLDLPMMAAVAVLLVPAFVTGLEVKRWEGALVLLVYGAYLAVLLVRVLAPEAAALALVALVVVTAVTLGAFVVPLVASARRRR